MYILIFSEIIQFDWLKCMYTIYMYVSIYIVCNLTGFQLLDFCSQSSLVCLREIIIVKAKPLVVSMYVCITYVCMHSPAPCAWLLWLSPLAPWPAMSRKRPHPADSNRPFRR